MKYALYLSRNSQASIDMDELKYCYKYPHPAITADAVVFGFDGRDLHILLVERGLEPYKGSWALPGGFMRIDETVEQCAARELREETGVTDVYLEQFHTFSGVARDPRERVVTVAFFALVRESDYRLIAGDDAARASWFEPDELPPLAFDHHDIIDKARRHIREVLRTRPIAFKLLDEKFSMDELQRLYEAINGTTYDRRNFRKKMVSTGLVRSRGASCRLGVNRAVNFFSFDEDAYDERRAADPKGRNPFDL